MVENLPANAGDTGSSPGLGRSHMTRGTAKKKFKFSSETEFENLCSAIRYTIPNYGINYSMASSFRIV